tara:strand:- start:324 stop:482 length:159 start_codon:yes stop_codon:yes gene_type:complete
MKSKQSGTKKDSGPSDKVKDLIHTILNTFPKSYVEKVTYFTDVEEKEKDGRL